MVAGAAWAATWLPLASDGIPVAAPVTRKVQRETSTAMPASDDAVLESIKNKWMPLYQRMNLLRHSLDKYGDDNSDAASAYRLPITNEIIDLEKQCTAIWDERDYYIANGRLPFVAEKTVEIPEDPIELANLISNLKKNIRRNRKEMKAHPDKPQYAQFYEQYKKQYKEVTGHEYVEKN